MLKLQFILLFAFFGTRSGGGSGAQLTLQPTGSNFTGMSGTKVSNQLLKLDAETAKYYHHVNLAARALFANDFPAAAAHYQAAFLCKKLPFFADLKNFIIVNSKCASFQKNETAIQLLFAAKKCDTSVLFQVLPQRVFSAENIALINKLQAKYRWKSQSENIFQKNIRQLYESEQSILQEFERLDTRDRECVKEYHEKKDSIRHENCLKLVAYCQSYGFPTEEDLGAFNAQGEEWGNMVYSLLWNMVTSKKLADRDAVLAIIKPAVQNGNLHHSKGACLFDLIWQNSKVKDPCFNFLNTTVELVHGDPYRPFVFFTDSLMREVNTNRVSIGLDSFHIVQKQVICQYFGAKKIAEDRGFLAMSHYSNINTGLPLGLVKMSFQEAGIEMSSYRIKIEKILGQCGCEEKAY